jgi:hypothetical protein
MLVVFKRGDCRRKRRAFDLRLAVLAEHKP